MLCETVSVTNSIYSIFSVIAMQTSEVCVAVAPSVLNFYQQKQNGNYKKCCFWSVNIIGEQFWIQT